MTLKARAREKVERAGISNYSFDQDILVMCGVRYTVEACDCGDLGDAVPHLSRTEDGDALWVHGRLEGVEPMNLRVGSLVVLAGLEPASSEPKSEMIDRYTTGLA